MSELKKGRKVKVDPLRVAGWRQTRNASIAETAKHFGISEKTVSNYCRDHGEQAKRNRELWNIRRDREVVATIEEEAEHLFTRMRLAQEAHEEFIRDPSWENFFRANSAANRLVPKEFMNKKPDAW